MPLTAKLKADYIELINNELDTITVDSIEDFDSIAAALEHTLNPNPNPDYAAPEKYADVMSDINNYILSPNEYVQL